MTIQNRPQIPAVFPINHGMLEPLESTFNLKKTLTTCLENCLAQSRIDWAMNLVSDISYYLHLLSALEFKTLRERSDVT